MPGQPYAATFLLEVDGTPLHSDLEPLLISAYVEDNLHLPDAFLLRFRDPDRRLLEQSGIRVGSRLTVSVATGDRGVPRRLVVGEVTGVEVEFDGVGTYTVVRGMDVSHRLFRGRVAETYQQVTLSDVVRTVARRAGVRTGSVESTGTVFEHLGQGGQSDWQFLRGLARESGHDLAVLDGQLTLSRPTSAGTAPAPGGQPATDPLVLHLGTDLLRLRATVSAGQQVDEVQVRGWDVARKRVLVGTSPAGTTSVELPVTPRDVGRPFGTARYVTGEVPYGTQAEVDEAATALAEQIGSSFAELEAVARGNPELRAGVAVALSNLGSPFDGKYTISSSRHQYDPETGYTVRLTVSGRHDRSLRALGGHAAVRGDRVAGVAVGQVSDVADPEGLGRVKVALPWLGDTYVTTWARTLQPGAGEDRGWVLVPEVGDEVLVGFEHGDLRRPYVLGGLHNGVDRPPAGPVETVDASAGAVQRRAFVSRTGHRVELVDESGSSMVEVQTGDERLRLRLDQAATTIVVSSDGKVRITAKDGITVDAGSSKIELSGSEIALRARNGVTVDGGAGTVGVRSTSSVDVQGTTVKVNGSGTAEVRGGASLSLAAALVRIN